MPVAHLSWMWMWLQVDVPAAYLAMSTPACPKMTRDWAFCRWAAAERKVMAIPPTTFYGAEYQVRVRSHRHCSASACAV